MADDYDINLTSGQVIATVQDGHLDTSSTSLTLIGQNTPNYGEPINENFVHLLENFAHVQSPPNPLVGQLWYNTNQNQNQLMVYTASGHWAPVTKFPIGDHSPETQPQPGHVYFDTRDNKAKIYHNGSWQDISYSGSVINGNGTMIKNLALREAGGDEIHNVMAIVDLRDYVETVQAIFSDHVDFELHTDDVYYPEFTQYHTGFGGTVVRRGLSIKQTASETPMWLTRRAYRSDHAYNLNTGSYSLNQQGEIDDQGGTVIPADTVYHQNDHIIPAQHATHDLGSPSHRFDQAHVNHISLSHNLSAASPTVTMGSSERPIKTLYVDTLRVSGDILVDKINDIVAVGSGESTVDTGYFDNLTVKNRLTVGDITTYTFPDHAQANHLLVLDAQGNLQWADYSHTVTNVVGTDGLSTRSQTYNTGGYTSTQVHVDLNYGSGIRLDENNVIHLDLTVFTTDDLAEGTQNWYYDKNRIRQSIHAGPGISYNPLTGAISLQDPDQDGRVTTVNAGQGLRTEYEPCENPATYQDDYATYQPRIHIIYQNGYVVVIDRVEDQCHITDPELRTAWVEITQWFNQIPHPRPADRGTVIRWFQEYQRLKLSEDITPQGLLEDLYTAFLAEHEQSEAKFGDVASVQTLCEYRTHNPNKTLHVNTGPGIKIHNNAVAMDPEYITRDFLTGDSNSMWGEVQVEYIPETQKCVIKLTDVRNSRKLGSQAPNYYLNTSDAYQEKVGPLTVSGIRFQDGKISSEYGNTLKILDHMEVHGTVKARDDITGLMFATLSDSRLKSHIQPLIGCVDKVNKLRPVSYVLKADTQQKTRLGFIAQEVEQVLPEVVHEDTDGYKAISYGNMVAVMFGAIQELSDRITTMENRLES